VTAKFKGKYLYIDLVEGPSDEKINERLEDFIRGVEDEEKEEKMEAIFHKHCIFKPSKLCRFKYIGDIENWGFEIYKYESYDT